MQRNNNTQPHQRWLRSVCSGSELPLVVITVAQRLHQTGCVAKPRFEHLSHNIHDDSMNSHNESLSAEAVTTGYGNHHAFNANRGKSFQNLAITPARVGAPNSVAAMGLPGMNMNNSIDLDASRVDPLDEFEQDNNSSGDDDFGAALAALAGTDTTGKIEGETRTNPLAVQNPAFGESFDGMDGFGERFRLFRNIHWDSSSQIR